MLVLDIATKLAVNALVAKEEDNAVVANEAVPNKEPVIPFETVREFKAAFEPLTMTRFQLGI